MSDTTVTGSRSWMRDALQVGPLLPGMISGVVIGITAIIIAVSLGSLIFTGDLSPYLPQGIGIALISMAVVLISTSLISSIPSVIGSLQESPAVLLSLLTAALVRGVFFVDPQIQLATVLAAIPLATLLTGAAFLLLGYFKLGGLVRYIPYPVMGGFLAGTGWLLATASIQVTTDLPVTPANLQTFLQPGVLAQWLPGVILALALYVGLKRRDHYLMMPALLIGAVIIFYLGLLATGTSIEEATRLGLLLGGLPEEVAWRPPSLASLSSVAWGAILRQSGNFIAILFLSLIHLLLNASGLELVIERDVDLNHELRTAGFVNLLSGLGGGMLGFQTLADTTLNYRIGARGRLSGILAGTLCALMLFAGRGLLALFPKPVLGGLLFYLGLDFLVEWVIGGWTRLSRTEYSIVILILVAIITTDFLVGIGVGILAMILLFVITYSRVDVVHHLFTGAEVSSNVARSVYHQHALKELGKQTCILELHGFIFFGTANTLMEQIRDRINDPGNAPVRFIILDFRRVTGLDSSAVHSFARGQQLAQMHEITLVLTGVPDLIRCQLQQGGFTEDDDRVRFDPDLDRGLEWCEDRLLELEGIADAFPQETLDVWLVEQGFQQAQVERLQAYLEQADFEPGEFLIRQDEQADDMYFINSGKVSIYLETEPGELVRLRTSDMGTVVGEIGLYLGAKRTASVIADEPSFTYRLTRETMLEMERKDPDLAAAFHGFLIRLLAEKLTDTNRLVTALNR